MYEKYGNRISNYYSLLLNLELYSSLQLPDPDPDLGLWSTELGFSSLLQSAKVEY